MATEYKYAYIVRLEDGDIKVVYGNSNDDLLLFFQKLGYTRAVLRESLKTKENPLGCLKYEMNNGRIVLVNCHSYAEYHKRLLNSPQRYTYLINIGFSTKVVRGGNNIVVDNFLKDRGYKIKSKSRIDSGQLGVYSSLYTVEKNGVESTIRVDRRSNNR